MMTGPALPCPRCKRVLEPHSWHDANGGTCRRCQAEFDFVAFPALNAAAQTLRAEAAVVDAESVCFFHPENRAHAVCEDCGRLICAVCTVPFMSRKVCPSCVANASKRNDAAGLVVRDRVLYDSIALSVAILPIVFVFITWVTAPLALGLVCYGWNKPGSLVHGRRRWRLILAGLFAVAEIIGWIAIFVAPLGRR